MQMKLSARALRSGTVVAEDAALAGKLARTFTMQVEGLAKLKGKRRSSKQTIIVKQEKHVHNHQHVHLPREHGENNGQPHDSEEGSRVRAKGSDQAVECAALPSPEPGGEVVPLRSREGQDGLPIARSTGRSAQG